MGWTTRESVWLVLIPHAMRGHTTQIGGGRAVELARMRSSLERTA